METTAASDLSDGPVLSLINKRIRALRKKQNRIIQMEESLAQGKVLNKEQEGVLKSKPGVFALIEELEKLRQPLADAVAEEQSLAVQRHQVSAPTQPISDDKPNVLQPSESDDRQAAAVEELLNLLYFGSLFDVKSQSDFTRIILTRTHERECCLTYDTITDDDTEMLAPRDLDLISSLGGFLISRPGDSSLSHKNALQQCLEHAKRWLAKSEQPIEPNSNVTYAGLRERLSKIMASDYFTTTPQMKEVSAAAAAGNYAPFQVPVHESISPVQVPVQLDFQQKVEDTANFQGHDTGDSQSSHTEELQKDEVVTENQSEAVSAQQEQVQQETEADYNQRDVEFEQQHASRRPYQNQRGGRGGGGRRGYTNGRGGRGNGRGGGSFQNGRNQYYDQPGSYYPRPYYNNNRGRGGRGGGSSFNHQGAAQEGHASANVGVAS
ncbi:hypothetical protein ACFX11_011547 [Malus domestica]